MTAHVGFKGQFGAGTTDVEVTERYEILRENIRKSGSIIVPPGIRGSRGEQGSGAVAGTYSVRGSFVMNPRPADLTAWLPRIMGASAVLEDELPEFRITVDRGHRRFHYDGCKVARATFRSSPGGLLELEIEVIGKTETVDSAAFPTLTLATTAPYVHHHGTMSLQSSSRAFDAVELTIDNQLIDSLFLNSATLTEIPEGGRAVTLNTSVVYNSTNADLYGQAVSGAAGSLTYTNGTVSLAFSFPKLQVPDQSPTINSKNGVTMLELPMTARMSGTDAEFTVVNDATP